MAVRYAFHNLPEGEREVRVFELVKAFFPTADRKGPWPVADPEAFADKLWAFLEHMRGVGSSGEVLAVQFIAQTWRNAKLCELVGHFDLVDAFERWDYRHRAVVLAWAQEPWGA